MGCPQARRLSASAALTAVLVLGLGGGHGGQSAAQTDLGTTTIPPVTPPVTVPSQAVTTTPVKPPKAPDPGAITPAKPPKAPDAGTATPVPPRAPDKPAAAPDRPKRPAGTPNLTIDAPSRPKSPADRPKLPSGETKPPAGVAEPPKPSSAGAPRPPAANVEAPAGAPPLPAGGAAGGRPGGTAPPTSQAGRTAAGAASSAPADARSTGAGGSPVASLGGPGQPAGASGQQGRPPTPAASQGLVSERLLAARRRGVEPELAQSIAGLEECVGALPASERRVLTLRAGLDGRRARSRAEAARTLGLSLREVRRVERRAVRRVWVLSGRLGCGFGSPLMTGGGVAATSASATIPGLRSSTGFVYDLVRFPAADASARGGGPLRLPALDQSPFSEVAVTSPAAVRASPEPGSSRLDAWLDRLLALLVGVLALLLILLLGLALRRGFGHLRVPDRPPAGVPSQPRATPARRLLGR